MGRGSAPAWEISFVSLVAYGPRVSDSALTMGVTASETRQGGSQHFKAVFMYLTKGSELMSTIMTTVKKGMISLIPVLIPRKHSLKRILRKQSHTLT